MNFITKLYRNKILKCFLTAGLAAFVACAPPAPNSAVGTHTNTDPINTNIKTNVANTAENRETSLSMPVTFPVLDAMFTDEQFAAELKSRLQLTDEQINRLKQISGDAVKNLSEDESGEYDGSTRAAAERADREIRQIIGDDKTKQLFELVRERWQGGAETAAPEAAAAKPNAVPTDTRIVVNAPAYRMDVFQNGKLIKTYKVGIGYPEFPLPSGLRKADTIIFNPTWTPPDEPWVKGKFKPGKTVKAGSKLNPLGLIKIPIGLPSLIHGGKDPARLGTFASHGCVGLTNSQIKSFALDLAELSGTELPTAEMENYLKEKTETKNVKLKTTIPVELRYETIVVENGVLKIFRDVYERGANTEENLRKVLEIYGVSLESLSIEDREKILAGLEQMAFDAKGNPVEANANSNSTNRAGNQNSKSSAVTKSIKGKKEVTFELAELKGKGYPAPVSLVSQ